MLTCIALPLLLALAIAAAPVAAKLARRVGPVWPARLRSTTALFLLSLVPAGVDGLCVILVNVSGVFSQGDAGPLAIILAGVLGGGWGLFLLFLTKQLGARSVLELWGLRAWLVCCLFAAAFVVLIGFGRGISQGTH
jgi:hypothetical protein